MKQTRQTTPAPFDLQLALRGEPVRLRDGQKAYVMGVNRFVDEQSENYLIGHSEDGDLVSWAQSGEYIKHQVNDLDIVEMWVDYPEPEEADGFFMVVVTKKGEKDSVHKFAFAREESADRFVNSVANLFHIFRF